MVRGSAGVRVMYRVRNKDTLSNGVKDKHKVGTRFATRVRVI